MKTKNTGDVTWLYWVAGAGCLAVLGTASGGCELIASVDPDALNAGGGGGSTTTATATTTTTTTSTTTSTSSPTSTSGGGEGGQGQGGSTSSVGGQGGTGGSDVCDGPEDCDDPGECKSPTCDEDGACGFTVESGTCDLVGTDDGQCDDTGTCVECLGEVNCPEPPDCQVATCEGGACGTVDADDGVDCNGGTCLDGACDIDPLCENGVLDAPNETDIDCGGTCPTCDNDDTCAVAGDCTSGFCSGTTCAACTGDGDCPGAQFCDPDVDGGTCTDDKDDGGDCDDAGECTSGFCADGFCCESACDGTCEACDGTGSCDPIGSGSNPDGECATGECVTGSCDGNRACGNQDDTQTCGSAPSCTGGIATLQDFCGDDTGTCAEAGTQNCAPYVCGATTCRTTCANNTQCSAGNYCNGTTCEPTLDPGDTCDETTDCTSGNCVDTVCCITACNGTCESCDLSGTEGTCTAIAPGLDPENECTAAGQSTACLTGTCNGASACTLKLDGDVGAPVCSGNVLCDGTTASCPVDCGTDADCPGTRFCDDVALGNSGNCLLKGDVGDPCTSGRQCTSASCGVATPGDCD